MGGGAGDATPVEGRSDSPPYRHSHVRLWFDCSGIDMLGVLYKPVEGRSDSPRRSVSTGAPRCSGNAVTGLRFCTERENLYLTYDFGP